MSPDLEREVNALHSRLCGALADPKRILILYALSDGDKSVGQLTQALGCPQPTVSRHLKTLRERGLVQASRQGSSVYYRLSDQRIIQALDILRAVLADMLRSQADLARSVASDGSQSPV